MSSPMRPTNSARLLLSLGVLAALLPWSAGCERATATPTQRKQSEARVPAVEVCDVRMYPWPETVRVQGSLLGNEEAIVGAKVAGRVEEVRVDLGTPVRTGDPLIVLDTRELELLVQQAEAQLAQACAAIGMRPEDSEDQLDRHQSPPVQLEHALLREAQANLRRGERLAQRNVISSEELDHLRATVEAAEARYASALNSVSEKINTVRLRRAELALAKQTLTDARVLAPFDGIVQARHVAPGEYVSVGQEVATIVRIDPLRFTAGVPERLAGRIAEQQTIYLEVAGYDQPLTAKVSRVSPALDLSSRSLLIEADVPNPELHLRSGRFAEAQIVIDPHARTLAVPAKSIVEFAGVEKVWLVRDGESVQQEVRTGRRRAGLVEIVEGLTAGDWIVTDASAGHAGKVTAIETKSDALQQASQFETESPSPLSE